MTLVLELKHSIVQSMQGMLVSLHCTFRHLIDDAWKLPLLISFLTLLRIQGLPCLFPSSLSMTSSEISSNFFISATYFWLGVSRSLPARRIWILWKPSWIPTIGFSTLAWTGLSLSRQLRTKLSNSNLESETLASIPLARSQFTMHSFGWTFIGWASKSKDWKRQGRESSAS